MNLTDFENELKNRGFDQFAVADLDRYINWGYAHVARRFPWYWERTSANFTINPGSYSTSLSGFTNFRSLDFVISTTSGQERALKPLSDEDFFMKWLPLDLTQSQYRGEPASYYIYENNLYILNPPSSARAFTVHYHRRVPLLVVGGDTPITPSHLDEAIVLASLIRCHKRSLEINLANQAEADLEEFFDDMRNDEEFLMAQQPSRVSPDDTWL